MDWPAAAEALFENIKSQAGARGAVVSEVLDQVVQWGAQLSKHGSDKWVMAVMNPQPCRFKEKPGKRCGMHALVFCDACGIPTCLAHSYLSFAGNAICWGCVREAQSSISEHGKKMTAEVRDALKFFRLKKDVIWEEIAAAYKKAALKWHPDRAKGVKERFRAEAQMKRINVAYDTLKRHFQEAA